MAIIYWTLAVTILSNWILIWYLLSSCPLRFEIPCSHSMIRKLQDSPQMCCCGSRNSRPALYVTEPIDGHLDCFHFFYYYELYCYEHAHTSLCVYVCFHFSSICTKGRKCWVFYVTSSFFQYLFLFIWLYRVFAVAWKLLVEACGSSSLTRDIIRAPCIGNAES